MVPRFDGAGDVAGFSGVPRPRVSGEQGRRGSPAIGSQLVGRIEC